MTLDEFEQKSVPMLSDEIASGRLPNEVGKYRTLEQVSLFLKNPQLWFASFPEFNDPFEGKCCLKDDVRVPLETRKSVQNQLHELMNKTGVLCLTDNLNNMLMWSHYADKHRGAILVFDMAADLAFFSAPFKVSYSFTYPSYPVLDFMEAIKTMACKYVRWQHENEIRILKPYFHGLRTLNKKALKRIIFGCRADEVAVKNIIESMHELGGYEHVELQNAVMNKHAYQLDYVLYLS